MAVENCRAHEGVKYVIRKSHAAHRRKTACQRQQESGSAGQHDRSDPSEAYQYAGPLVILLVILLPAHKGIREGPAGNDLTIDSVIDDGHAHKGAESDHGAVDPGGALSAEYAELEQRDANQH